MLPVLWKHDHRKRRFWSALIDSLTGLAALEEPAWPFLGVAFGLVTFSVAFFGAIFDEVGWYERVVFDGKDETVKQRLNCLRSTKELLEEVE